MIDVLEGLPEIIIKTSVPAIIIAVVGHVTIKSLEHKFWRLRKLTDLQDETFRRARSLLVELVELPNAMAVSATLSSKGSADATAVDPAMIASASEKGFTLIKQMAELSPDVDRLFSDRAFAALADAVQGIKRLYARLLESTVNAERPELLSKDAELESLRGDSVFRVRSALSIMSSEIGQDPDTTWSRMRHKARFGRRKGDVPQDLFALSLTPPPDYTEKGRRYSDKLWRKLLSLRQRAPDREN